jgi:CO/xanthine dehydrogenase Mo-binding subunit
VKEFEMAGHPSIDSHPNVNQWIEFITDGRILIHTGKVDIGQRISTALALIAADEFDVEYDRIDIKRTETDIDPNEGFTSGSMSMQHSGEAVRLASATAREFMMKLAAAKLGVQINTLEVTDGLVQSRDTNETVTYWELMANKEFNLPVNQKIIVKSPDKHKFVGTRVVPKDMADIITGGMTYIHDISMTGMLHARLVRPPHYLAKLKSLDNELIKRLAKDNISIVRDGSFIAVVAPDEYLAIKAAARISTAVEWDFQGGLPTGELFDALTSNKRVSLPVAPGGAPVNAPVPPLGDISEGADISLSARFEKPYHMHGSIGPSAGGALYKEKKLTVWTHNQGVYPLRVAIAEALDMNIDDIHITFVPGSGCYGHNGADDAAYDAALIARANKGKPVLLKWTRDDEHAWEPYGSAMVCKLRASLSKEGRVLDWSHESYGDTHMGRPTPGRSGSPAEKLLATHLQENPLDWPVMPPTMGAHVGVHRNLEPLYNFPNPRLVKNLVRDLPLRVSALRTLGAFANVSALESFMDELAEAGNISPVEFRLNHLDDEKAIDVINTLNKKMIIDEAGKRESLGSGIAFAQYKNSAAYCAVGLEVEINDTAEVVLHRAWIVADAGEVVDPDGLIAQLEGGLIQAASWSLMEEVTFDSGGITSRDWENYPILRFNNIPEIDTILMDRPGEPFLGAGEASSGPTGGAIINAIYNAIGLRLRRMPFNADAIRSAAMN